MRTRSDLERGGEPLSHCGKTPVNDRPDGQLGEKASSGLTETIHRHAGTPTLELELGLSDGLDGEGQAKHREAQSIFCFLQSGMSFRLSVLSTDDCDF